MDITPYTDYIGTRLFHDGYKPEILDRILNSERLDKVIQELAQRKHQNDSKSLKSLRKEYRTLAEKILQQMIANISSTRATRFFGWTVKVMLTRMYHHGVHIRETEIQRLRETAALAAEQGVSLIFLPCHKSHIDYLVVSYILYSVGIALPHIAAGDNLNLPGIGTLLRYNGAFFIRRQWGDDKLYVAVMKEYIELLMEKGYNIEAFIEGTRSRTGKLLRPKFGILKSCLDAVYSGRVKNAFLVPVSIGYDKVIETPSYVDELLGRPKEKESLGQLVNSGFNLLQLKWGRIDVRFGSAISLRSFIDEKSIGAAIAQEKILQSLGYEYDI